MPREAPRKLIEVSLPLTAINEAAAREKSIRHGHPSTLHLWWARRPLAACRAVLFAQLVDDPSAHPERFPTDEAQRTERERLFRIIEQLVTWEASNDERVLGEARDEIRRSCGEDLPVVLDPFCGGGSIPLEAQRLGLATQASDLNPVAVLITKALVELPPRFARRPPVHPRTNDGRLDLEQWTAARGLAEDVRYYGMWMRDEAARRIGSLYPRVVLTTGREANVIAWIWARVVTCPNPACRGTMPLVRSFWLGKKKGKEAWVRPVIEGKGVRFEIAHDPSGPALEGTVTRNGALCLVCSSPVPLAYVRAEGKARRMGAQMMAVVAEGDRERIYLAPDPEQVRAAEVGRPEDVPDTAIPYNPRYLTAPNYGMTHHADLFTNRQLTALVTLADLVKAAKARILGDGADPVYADVIATYLALAMSRVTANSSVLCTWNPAPSKEGVNNAFRLQTVSMVWDFGELNPLHVGPADIETSAGWVAQVLEAVPTEPEGSVAMTNAVTAATPRGTVVSTDPPYYDNVGYADLADFFYIWLRRAIGDVYPTLFKTVLTPKFGELVADPFRAGGDLRAAKEAFESGFERAFSGLSAAGSATPMTVYYAFKQTQVSLEGDVTATGWETMLEGLLRSGWAVTATWPIRSERQGRPRDNASNALASSILLTCRQRSVDAGISDRRGFLADLKRELPGALRYLQEGFVAPVDLAQAAIGPGMAVFSRYAKVVEPEGSTMRVRTALALINQALDEVLAEQEGEFDADTRWSVAWFEQNGFQPGRFGEAELLSKAKVTSMDHLVEMRIVIARGGVVRLLRRDEFDERDEGNVRDASVWTLTQRLIHCLDTDGEQATARLMQDVGAKAEAARDLAYRLFVVAERRGWAADALTFNELVVAWPELTKVSASLRSATQETML